MDEKNVSGEEREVRLIADTAVLDGTLGFPAGGARGIVLFAHGSGSSRHSPRNRMVAGILRQAGFATLLMDLLTSSEEAVDMWTAELRFDIELLAERVLGAVRWLKQESQTRELPRGYFGASTGAAAALVAAARQPEDVRAVVSRGGRPDLAGAMLSRVSCPTLLIVGGNDHAVIDMNREAMAQMQNAQTRLEIVPGATHLFEEPGTLEQVAQLTVEWFERTLSASREQGHVPPPPPLGQRKHAK